MAILVPSKTLGGGGNVGIGALTGLLQGLAQGIPVGQQLKNRRRLTDIEEGQFGLQKQQIGRKNAAEDASMRVAQALAELGMMGGGAAPQSQPSEQVGPVGMGSVAPPQPAFGSVPEEVGVSVPRGAPQAPPPNARIARIHEVIRQGGFTPEEGALLTEAVRRDEHLRAIGEGADRITSDLQTGLQQGAFRTVDRFGNPDGGVDENGQPRLSKGEVAAQAIFDQIRRADRSDPQRMAVLLDKAEEALKGLKLAGADAQAAFEQHQHQDQVFQAERANLAQMPQAPGRANPAMEQTGRLLKRWQGGLLSDEQMAAQWPDALAGTLDMKQDAAKMAAKIQELEMHNAQLNNYILTQKGRVETNRVESTSQGGLDAASQRKIKEGVAIARERKTTQDKSLNALEEQKLRESIARTLALKHQRHGFPSETPEEKAAYEAEEAQMLEDAGLGRKNGQSGGMFQQPEAPAPSDLPDWAAGHEEEVQDLMERYKTGEIDRAELQEELDALGIDALAPR